MFKPAFMEEENIVKIETRHGEYYDFYRVPPEPIRKNTGYVFIIARMEPGTDHDLLCIGSSDDLPRLLKKKQVRTFLEQNRATHVLIFRADAHDDMEQTKEEILEKYPSLKQDFRVPRRKRALA
jgi:hypothetical protein